MALLRWALLLAAFVVTPSCYQPHQPPCAFSCAADGLCPSGFTCGGDGVCHRDGAQGICEIDAQVDAAQDAVQDAGSDADSDGGAPDGDAAD